MMMNQMISSVFDKFLFPPPPSILLTAMSVISFVSLTNAGVSEIKGKHLQYSKFRYFNGTSSSSSSSSSSSDQKPIVKNSNKMEEKKKIMFSGRTGMLILYTPAFLVGVLSFWVFSNDMGDLRFLLVNSALTIHFFKRVFEVLFVHKYNGGMIIDSAIPISLSYFISTASMIYNQHLLQGVPEPSIDLKYAGVVLFSVGILGNFYHHYLLSKLRAKDGEGYKIPKGGLFNIIICPHYLFEILIFVGISLISQSLYPISFTVGSAMYLTGRSYATRKWYLSKFPNFPKHVKALIPFVY